MDDKPLRYKTFDHTSDLGVQVFGESRVQLFKNARMALIELLIGKVAITSTSKTNIEIEDPDIEILFHDFLAECLYLFWSEDKIVSQIESITLKPGKLEATLKIGNREMNNIEILREIKAITYHQLEVKKHDQAYFASFVVDI